MRERLPIIAIVGRPNVGKSTLFNRLVGKRQAIVGDRPGVTVDRLETTCMLHETSVVLVDTGGIGEDVHNVMQPAIDSQVEAALDIADIVLFTVDAQSGATPVDMMIGEKLRRASLPTILVVNKAENPNAELDFFKLGLGDPVGVSAMHGHGVRELIAHILSELPEFDTPTLDEVEPLASITVIGRPNVGKSTLINAWLGYDRMVVSPIAGTTRDAIDMDMPYGAFDNNETVRLIDTAGQRKHGRIKDVIEFVARVKAVQAFRRADTAVMVLDGSEGIVEQDMRLMTLAHEEGCALLVVVNKLDLLTDSEWDYYAERLNYRMRGLADVPVFRMSAKEGQGTKRLLKEAVAAAKRNATTVNTGELNRWLMQAQDQQRAPSDHGKSVVRLKYVSQVGSTPPRLKVFCNRPSGIKASYLRYLEQSFRKRFNLPGVPVLFIFTASDNPYMNEDGTKKASSKPAPYVRGRKARKKPQKR
ncbi:MAG: ribosome biogenesis GTPase Der [Mariprofundaceae bacterium]|nr:ribosome biogenesis GTPase Der [Mariprofundaceae bacterium]